MPSSSSSSSLSKHQVSKSVYTQAKFHGTNIENLRIQQQDETATTNDNKQLKDSHHEENSSQQQHKQHESSTTEIDLVALEEEVMGGHENSSSSDPNHSKSSMIGRNLNQMIDVLKLRLDNIKYHAKLRHEYSDYDIDKNSNHTGKNKKKNNLKKKKKQQ